MMKPRLTLGLSDEEARLVTIEFKASPLFREQLIKLLEKDIDSSLKSMKYAVQDNVMNLTEFYAAELAKQETLEYVIKLLKGNIND